jgi:hypothetical protein
VGQENSCLSCSREELIAGLLLRPADGYLTLCAWQSHGVTLHVTAFASRREGGTSPRAITQSSLHICEDKFETGVNVTPEGYFVDLHHGGFPLLIAD